MAFLNYIRDLPRTIETIVPLPPCPTPLSELQFAKDIIGIEEVKQWDGILDCEVMVKKGETVREVKTGGDRAGFVIAGADDRAKAVALADRAEEFIKFIIAK